MFDSASRYNSLADFLGCEIISGKVRKVIKKGLTYSDERIQG